MPDIKPLRGIFYNKAMIGNLSLVIAPPYDVIPPNDQENLYERSPYNIVRLIKGKEYPKDTPDENAHTRANQYLQRWLREGILLEDKSEACICFEFL